MPPLPEVLAEVEGGAYLRGHLLASFHLVLQITVSPLQIVLNRFWIVKIFACGAQIWTDLQEIKGGHIFVALN